MHFLSKSPQLYKRTDYLRPFVLHVSPHLKPATSSMTILEKDAFEVSSATSLGKVITLVGSWSATLHLVPR